MGIFNKTFFKFTAGFVGILLLGFVGIIAVGYMDNQTKEQTQVPAAVAPE